MVYLIALSILGTAPPTPTMTTVTTNTTTTTRPTTVKSILVVSGYHSDNGVSDAQVVTPNEPTKTCSLPPLPKGLVGATASLIEETIILCGGWIDGQGHTSDCQIYDKESSSWKMTTISSR